MSGIFFANCRVTGLRGGAIEETAVGVEVEVIEVAVDVEEEEVGGIRFEIGVVSDKFMSKSSSPISSSDIDVRWHLGDEEVGVSSI